LCAGQVATPTTVRKIEPIESEDGTAWAVPIDEDAERYVGARVTDVLPSALPAKLRAIFDGASERMRTRG
jgi:hypothetical protein